MHVVGDFWTDGRGARGDRLDERCRRLPPEHDEGRARRPALMSVKVRRPAYQLVPLQPFVPPEQVRTYEPGDEAVFVMTNVPLDFDTCVIE